MADGDRGTEQEAGVEPGCQPDAKIAIELHTFATGVGINRCVSSRLIFVVAGQFVVA